MVIDYSENVLEVKSMETWYVIFQIILILTVIPGLWIAKMVSSRFEKWMEIAGFRGMYRRRVVKYILWLALGWLFTAPLMNLLRLFLVPFVFILQNEQSKVNTLVGTVSGRVYMTSSNLLLLLVFTGVFWTGKHFLTHPVAFPQRNGLTVKEKFFILIAVADLVFELINMTTIQILSLPLPLLYPMNGRGILGFVAGWIIGALILLLILVLEDCVWQWRKK